VSFDVYLQAFHHGKSAGIPRRGVREAFGAHVQEAGPNFWRIRYDDLNSCEVDLAFHQGDSAAIESLAVHRPCGDQRLWDSLAVVLALGNVVLFFPGCRAPLIGSSEVVTHLPADMIEALGEPCLVKDGSEVLNEVRAV
jgi:hypothetical protein